MFCGPGVGGGGRGLECLVQRSLKIVLDTQGRKEETVLMSWATLFVLDCEGAMTIMITAPVLRSSLISFPVPAVVITGSCQGPFP
jgi:hypothetical protein